MIDTLTAILPGAALMGAALAILAYVTLDTIRYHRRSR